MAIRAFDPREKSSQMTSAQTIVESKRLGKFSSSFDSSFRKHTDELISGIKALMQEHMESITRILENAEKVSFRQGEEVFEEMPESAVGSFQAMQTSVMPNGNLNDKNQEELQRIDLDLDSFKEKTKKDQTKIKLNKHLPYLVGNIVEISKINQEAEEDGVDINLESQRKDKYMVLKSSTHQPVVDRVDISVRIGVNEGSYLILDTLPSEYNSHVKITEVDEKTTENIRSLEKQIQELVEAKVQLNGLIKQPEPPLPPPEPPPYRRASCQDGLQC